MPKWTDEGETELLEFFFGEHADLYLGLYKQKVEPAEDVLLPKSAWAASTAYSVGDIRRPVTPNGLCYKCTVGGTSGGSEPSWPTTKGNTVVDNTVTWTCWQDVLEEEDGTGYARIALTDTLWGVTGDLAQHPEVTFECSEAGGWGYVEGYFIATTSDNTGKALAVENFKPSAAALWTPSTAKSADDKVVPVNRNGYWYICTVAGTTGTSEPTWPTTLTQTVVDGTVTWRCEGRTGYDVNEDGFLVKITPKVRAA